MRPRPTILTATWVALVLALAPGVAGATTAFGSITEEDADGVWRCGEQLQFFTQFSTSDETEPLQDVRFFYQLPPFLQLESNSLTTTLPNTTVVSGGGGQDTFVDVRWTPHNLGSVQTIRYLVRVSCCPPVFDPPVYQSGRFLWFVQGVEVEAWPSITAQQPPVAPNAPSVTKDDGGITATPGSAITYVVVPTQSGTAELADVVLTETVPADTTFSAAGSAPWSCAGTAAGSTCTIAIPALGCDASTGYPFRVVVDPVQQIDPGRTEIANRVDLASPAGAATGTDTTPLFIPAPDLAVGLGDGGALATAGATYIYSVTAANDGNVDLAAGSGLSVTLDPRTSFAAVGSSSGWSCDGGTCSRTLPAMASGSAPRVFQLAVTVASPLPAGVTQLTATATGTLAGDVDPSNDTDAETTPVDSSTTGPDLAVDLGDGGALATAGAPFVYTVSVANEGNQHLAAGAGLSVELALDTAFRAAGSSGGWSCSGANCSRTLPVMNAGAAARVFQLAVTVASPLPAGTTDFEATATVAVAGDLDSSNDARRVEPGLELHRRHLHAHPPTPRRRRGGGDLRPRGDGGAAPPRRRGGARRDGDRYHARRPRPDERQRHRDDTDRHLDHRPRSRRRPGRRRRPRDGGSVLRLQRRRDQRR